MEEFAKQMEDANHNSVTQEGQKKVTQIWMWQNYGLIYNPAEKVDYKFAFESAREQIC